MTFISKLAAAVAAVAMTRVKSEPEHLDGAQRGGSTAGGRRKQSKPIRVFMDIDGDAPATATSADDVVPDTLLDASTARADAELDMDVDSALSAVPDTQAYTVNDDSQHSNDAASNAAATTINS